MSERVLPSNNQLIQQLIDCGLLVQVDDGSLAFRDAWLAGFLAGHSPADVPKFRLSGRWGSKAVIGVTGNIAVGKSTALAMLNSLGAYVIDADKLVHQLRQPGAPGYSALVNLLGEGILLPDGRVNTQLLAEKAFADASLLTRLEAIFRPLVVEEVRRQGQSTQSRVVVIEAIKLLEGDLRTEVDCVWVIDAPRIQQVKRLMASRGLSQEEAERRIDAQRPQAEKLAQADVIIHNDGDRTTMWQQIITAWSDTLGVLWHMGWLTDDLVERFVAARTGLNPALSLAHILAALSCLANHMAAGISITPAEAANLLP